MQNPLNNTIIPGLPGQIAGKMYWTLAEYLPPQSLSLGGGTVLAARWNHRRSFDVDLFCDPGVYASLGRNGFTKLEAAIKDIQGCASERTWCDPIAVYAEIEGVEVTLLPRAATFGANGAGRLAGTGLALQPTTQIIHAKLVSRMYEGGEIVIRDLFDVACAACFDSESLHTVLDEIGPRILYMLSEILKMLPPGWTADTEKPLAEPSFDWNEAELIQKVLGILTQHSPEIS